MHPSPAAAGDHGGREPPNSHSLLRWLRRSWLRESCWDPANSESQTHSPLCCAWGLHRELLDAPGMLRCTKGPTKSPKARKGTELALQQTRSNDKTSAHPNLCVRMILTSPTPCFSFSFENTEYAQNTWQCNPAQRLGSLHPQTPFQFFCFKHIGYELLGYRQLPRVGEILQ